MWFFLPRNQKDVENIVAYCDEHHIPLYVYGGGSTVTRRHGSGQRRREPGYERAYEQGGPFNEINHTITVQAGMWGPELERILNNAPETLQATRRYTLRHFPQSFEHSSVGGWVVTRGAGQNSTYYGKIEDMVIAQEYVTPRGIFKTPEYPRCATGPDFDQIMMGSEGTFGVLTNVTLRVCPLHARKHPAFPTCSRTGRTRGSLPRDHAGRIWLSLRFPPFRPGGNRRGHAHLPHPRYRRRYASAQRWVTSPCSAACCWAPPMAMRISARWWHEKVSTHLQEAPGLHPDPFQGHQALGEKPLHRSIHARRPDGLSAS